MGFYDGSDPGNSPTHKTNMQSVFNSGFKTDAQFTHDSIDRQINVTKGIPQQVDSSFLQQKRTDSQKDRMTSGPSFTQRHNKESASIKGMKVANITQNRSNQPLSNKDIILQMRAQEKELDKFKAAYEAKLNECNEEKHTIEPVLVKLWDLAGQPDPHGLMEDTNHGRTTMAEIPMTMIPHEQFMKFLGTLQIVLFGIRPNFYPASYLKEMEMLKERKMPPVKPENNFSDFSEQIFKLFGGNIHLLSFEEISMDIREILNQLHTSKVNPKTKAKSIKQRTFE